MESFKNKIFKAILFLGVKFHSIPLIFHGKNNLQYFQKKKILLKAKSKC